MKIDDDFIQQVTDAIGQSPVAWDCVDPRELCATIIEVFVQNQIESYRECLSKTSKNSLSAGWFNVAIKALEDLIQ